MSIKFNQRGDTIVEVLIAIAVVGLVLAGALNSARRSTQAVQRSNERGEAIKVAESQVESLRTNATSDAPTVYTASSPFCMDISTNAVGAHPADCAFGPDGRYEITITRTTTGGTTTFAVQNEWDAIGGQNRDNTIMYYRISN